MDELKCEHVEIVVNKNNGEVRCKNCKTYLYNSRRKYHE